MNGTNNEEQTTGLLRVFGRHLVALCVTYRTARAQASGRPSSFFNCPGVLLSVRGVHFFMTAGHALQRLEEGLRSGQMQYERSALADTFGLDRISNLPIPFDLPSHQMIHIDQAGLDFGLIPLSDYYIQLLLRNGVRVISEENWGRLDSIDFSHYFVFGIPDELSSAILSPEGDAFLGTALINVRRLDRMPEPLPTPPAPQFIGVINRDQPLRSLVGMSGGPIFGCVFGEQIRYWIIALQTTWYEDSRVIIGTPVPLVASIITSFMNQRESTTQ